MVTSDYDNMTSAEVAKEIRGLAHDYGYNSVDTKSGGAAVVGFDTWEEAEKFADMQGLRLALLSRRDGARLFEGDNDYLLYAPKVDYEDFGGEWQYDGSTEEEAVADGMKGFIEGMDDVCAIEEAAIRFAEIWEAVQGLGDDEILVVFDNLKFEAHQEHTMDWWRDGSRYVVGSVVEM